MTVSQLVNRFEQLDAQYASASANEKKQIEKTQSIIQYLLNKKLGTR